MPTTVMLLFVVPFLVLVLVFGIVVVVALCQAKPEDVPSVLREGTGVFRRLVDRVPASRPLTARSTEGLPSADARPGLGVEDVA